MEKLVIGNLKMNMENVSQRDLYCKELLEEFSRLQTKHTVVMCPPMVYLEHFCRFFDKSQIRIGAQDCFWELYGSYTGNTTPTTSFSLGGTYTLIGHSEHREYNHETDADVANKVKIALRVGLIPVVCVGFLTYEDEIDSIRSQIESIMNVCDAKEIEKIVFAYEPVWAIGSGKTPKSDEIHTVVMCIRSIFTNAYGKVTAAKIKILYGGSVVAENVTEVCTKAYADGVLVGRASLSPVNFIRIVRMLK
jgi:triosephosphate isomerase